MAERQLDAATARLFNNDLYHDIVVQCEEEKWYAHRAIVCPRSGFFVKACNGKFRESRDKIITLHEDEPQVVDKMLRYIYSADYDDQSTNCEPADTKHLAMLINVKVHTIADKYDVPGLSRLAEVKFQALAISGWALDDFALAIQEMFTVAPSTKTSLQKKAVEIAAKHATQLYAEKDSLFRTIAVETPEFASNLAEAILVEGARKRSAETRYRCPFCSMEHVRTTMGGNESGVYSCPYCRMVETRHWWQVVKDK